MHMGSPTLDPVPKTILITPGGKPASTKACMRAKAVAEVISLGLQTTVLPHASAGANLKDN